MNLIGKLVKFLMQLMRQEYHRILLCSFLQTMGKNQMNILLSTYTHILLFLTKAVVYGMLIVVVRYHLCMQNNIQNVYL